MIVKVCGVTNLADAEVAIQAGANALGFNFYPPSPRYIAPAAARAIIDRLPGGIIKAGIFVNETPAAVEATSAAAGLDVAQVIGETPAAVRSWKVCRVGADFAAGQLDDPRAEAYLLDTPSAALYGGTGHAFDWSLARIEGKRIVIAGGLGPSNVAEAIRVARPWGVDACSRLESSPGRKDPAAVRAFVEAALNV
ncbi:MAG: phosphoribosylanthranilate isomerase [Acidobacteria bacterium]|nr:phosphoribosylanthranilate isomerase [Acidobacteriota bacterium]